MKRTQLPRRTPLPRRRVPMRPRSLRMARTYVHRRRLVAELLEARPWCEVPECTDRSVDVHELLSRARGGSILDVANLAAVCRGHHAWITQNPAAAEAAGWALPSPRRRA